MMFNGLIEKIELYIVSLWFLFLLIILITIQIPTYFGTDWQFIGVIALLKINVIPTISLAFVILGLIFYIRFEYRVSGSTKISVKIVKIEDVNYEHLTFLTTYIIPLICFNLSSTRYVISLAILLIVIGIIYVKTDKFYANPTLAILGYQIYKADLETRVGLKKNIILITKTKLKISDLVQTRELDQSVSFARKINDNR